MEKRKKIAIVLFVIQAVGLFGGFINGEIFDQNLFEWIGFLLPCIIGLCLWFGKDKENKG